MADGYFERGEIYTVRMDNGLGSEEGAFRPGVIISSATGNRSSNNVIITYMTTKPRTQSHVIETMATGQLSRILTDQIATVDKKRLGRLLGVLTPSEMSDVDSAIEKVLDLGYVDDGKDTEIAILKAQIAAAEESKQDELLSLKVECEMWKKMYTKALDFVVEQNVAGAIAVVSKKSAPKPKPEPAVVPEPKVEPVVVESGSPVTEESVSPVIVESGLIDINHCTETELKKLGFSTPMARLIKSYRPFKDVPDLKRVPGMSKVKYQIIEKKVCCVPVPVVAKVEEPPVSPEPKEETPKGKININTATGAEIREFTDMPEADAYSISGYRKKNGPYACLDDLLNVKRISSGKLEKYRSMLEV